jgi:hypothetical protein
VLSISRYFCKNEELFRYAKKTVSNCNLGAGKEAIKEKKQHLYGGIMRVMISVSLERKRILY